jgi:hypothetical protein
LGFAELEESDATSRRPAVLESFQPLSVNDIGSKITPDIKVVSSEMKRPLIRIKSFS